MKRASASRIKARKKGPEKGFTPPTPVPQGDRCLQTVNRRGNRQPSASAPVARDSSELMCWFLRDAEGQEKGGQSVCRSLQLHSSTAFSLNTSDGLTKIKGLKQLLHESRNENVPGTDLPN